MRNLAAIGIGLVASLAAACGAQSPQPCTQCEMVAATYALSAPPTVATCGDATTLDFPGVVGNATIYQQGSELDVRFEGTSIESVTNPDGSSGQEPFDFDARGVMHTDGSVEFEPYAVTVVPQNGDGMEEPGQLRLEGFFVPTAGGALAFYGTFVTVNSKDGCEVDSSFSGTQGGNRAHPSRGATLRLARR